MYLLYFILFYFYCILLFYFHLILYCLVLSYLILPYIIFIIFVNKTSYCTFFSRAARKFVLILYPSIILIYLSIYRFYFILFYFVFHVVLFYFIFILILVIYLSYLSSSYLILSCLILFYFIVPFFWRAQRDETFLFYCTPFCLESFSLYPFLARAARRNFFDLIAPLCCLEKVCVVNFGFQNPRKFQLKRNFPLGRGTTTTTTFLYLGRPQGVWESKFPVGNSFLLRGTEKKTQTLEWSGKKWV